VDDENSYTMIGREQPSTCERISQHEQTDMAGGRILPQITEECTSVETEMLETITGQNSLNRISAFLATFVLKGRMIILALYYL